MKKAMHLTAVVILLTVNVPAWAGPKEDINAAYNTWAAALSSGKADNVVNLYADDAVLLATLAEKPIVNQSQRLEYFKTLVSKHEMKVELTELHTRLLDDDNAVLSGLYTFSFKDGDKTTSIPARFTFVYEKERGKWMIVEHHSSKVPHIK